MSNAWLEKISGVINPNTKETLVSEGRVLGISHEDGHLKIKYSREGISPTQKRDIEDQIYQAIGTSFDNDRIIIMTVSESSDEVLEAAAKSNKDSASTKSAAPQKAGLKVGHGTVGTPKKIEGIKKIIAVASGKGGVGKSTFTTNLACTLSNLGHKVGVIDADIYGPSIPMMMGVRTEKPLASKDKKIMPVEKHGVKLMSFGFFIEEKDPVIWRGPMLGGVLFDS